MSVDRAEWAMQKPRLLEWMAWRRYLIATRASSGETYNVIEESAWIRLVADLDGVDSSPCRDDPRHPPIEAEHEVEEAARIPRHEQERYSGEEHERPDQTPAVPPIPPAPVLSSAGSGASTAEEDPEQDVVRDRK